MLFVRGSSAVGAMVSLPRPDSHAKRLGGVSKHIQRPHALFPSRNTSVGFVHTSRLSSGQYCRELSLTPRPAIRRQSTVLLTGVWRERQTQSQHVHWRRFHLGPRLSSSDDERQDGTFFYPPSMTPLFSFPPPFPSFLSLLSFPPHFAPKIYTFGNLI